MGSFLSRTKRPKTDGGGHQFEPGEVGDGAEAKCPPGEVDHPRLTELMQALQRIARLQREATGAHIRGRQKRREAANKRQDVWMRDANFMTEIQRLVAQGKFAGFEELLSLASQCQESRDGLGQVEQEAIDTEQQWEGQIWKLREAEIQLYDEFEREFALAETYSPAPSSFQSSPFGSSSDVASQDEEDVATGQAIFPYPTAGSVASSASIAFMPQVAESITQDQMLLGLGHFQSHGQAESEAEYTAEYLSDSGIGDIDGPVWERPETNLKGFPQQLPPRKYPAIELFPELLVDFASRRERINRWLEDIILDSPLESISLFGILQTRLASEKKDMPSNWSQLVIAFWELDGAAVPRSRRRSDRQSTEEIDNVSQASFQEPRCRGSDGGRL